MPSEGSLEDWLDKTNKVIKDLEEEVDMIGHPKDVALLRILTRLKYKLEKKIEEKKKKKNK